MIDDISQVLRDWPFASESGLQVRTVEGRDGAPKLQIRIDLGVLQMETVGRPDGIRPFGRESLLDHYRQTAEEHRARTGWYEGFELSTSDCAALRQESLQYYHRRITRMALQDYAGAVQDADHNLSILELLKAFARDREDWLASDQYRPFIMSHRVQALALMHLSGQEDVKAAFVEVERGIRQVKEIFAEQQRLDEFEDSSEYASLDELRRKLEARYGISYRQRLRLMLDDALRREDPDQASELRSQLRRLETTPDNP